LNAATRKEPADLVEEYVPEAGRGMERDFAYDLAAASQCKAAELVSSVNGQD
jgi:hypothetical protein